MSTARSQGLTLPELSVATEVEYRTLHMWLRRGLIRASIEKATGSGTPNVFDETDILEARVLADLRRLGAEMSVLERTATALRDQNIRLTGEETLVINGTVEIVTDGDLAATIASCAPSFVFATSHAKRALAEASL